MRLDQQFRAFLTARARRRARGRRCSLPACRCPLSDRLRTATGPAAAAPAVQPRPRTAAVVNGTPLTMDEAVRMALENNLGIQAERLNPRDPELRRRPRATRRSRPSLFSSVDARQQHDAADRLPHHRRASASSDQRQSLTTARGLQQILPFGGANYQFSFDGSRATTDAPTHVFNPQLGSHLNATYTQPLLRNFKIDTFRQQLLSEPEPAAGRRHPAAAAGHPDVAERARRLLQPGWRDCRARRRAAVARPGARVAQEQPDARRGRARWRRSTSSSAEAEVASNEENVIIAEAAIETRAGSAAGADHEPVAGGLLERAVQAGGPADADAAQAIDIDAAIKNALANRTDILAVQEAAWRAPTSIGVLREPEAAGGRPAGALRPDRHRRHAVPVRQPVIDGEIPPIIGHVGAQLRRCRCATSSATTSGRGASRSTCQYPLGTSLADAAVAQNKLQQQQQQTTLRDLEMQVTTQVREAGRR